VRVSDPVGQQLDEPSDGSYFAFKSNISVHFHSALHPEHRHSREGANNEELEDKDRVKNFIHEFH